MNYLPTCPFSNYSIACIETLDVQPSVAPDLGIQCCNFFFLNHKGEVSAAKIVAILTQVLLSSRFPGPRSVIHMVEIEHSRADTLWVRGEPWLRCQPCEATGGCGTIKLFLEAASHLFPSSSLVGTAGRASLVFVSLCSVWSWRSPSTWNTQCRHRARCCFPLSLLWYPPRPHCFCLECGRAKDRKRGPLFNCCLAGPMLHPALPP